MPNNLSSRKIRRTQYHAVDFTGTFNNGNANINNIENSDFEKEKELLIEAIKKCAPAQNITDVVANGLSQLIPKIKIKGDDGTPSGLWLSKNSKEDCIKEITDVQKEVTSKDNVNFDLLLNAIDESINPLRIHYPANIFQLNKSILQSLLAKGQFGYVIRCDEERPFIIENGVEKLGDKTTVGITEIIQSTKIDKVTQNKWNVTLSRKTMIETATNQEDFYYIDSYKYFKNYSKIENTIIQFEKNTLSYSYKGDEVNASTNSRIDTMASRLDSYRDEENNSIVTPIYYLFIFESIDGINETPMPILYPYLYQILTYNKIQESRCRTYANDNIPENIISVTPHGTEQLWSAIQDGTIKPDEGQKLLENMELVEKKISESIRNNFEKSKNGTEKRTHLITHGAKIERVEIKPNSNGHDSVIGDEEMLRKTLSSAIFGITDNLIQGESTYSNNMQIRNKTAFDAIISFNDRNIHPIKQQIVSTLAFIYGFDGNKLYLTFDTSGVETVKETELMRLDNEYKANQITQKQLIRAKKEIAKETYSFIEEEGQDKFLAEIEASSKNNGFTNLK